MCLRIEGPSVSRWDQDLLAKFIELFGQFYRDNQLTFL